MKRSLLIFMTSLVMTLSAIPFEVYAEESLQETIVSAEQSEVEWTIEDGTLISVSLNSETSVIIPDEVRVIGNNAFNGCSELLSVVFPEELTEIESGAFMGCNLQTLDLPGSLKIIGKKAFADNTELQEITVPEGVQSMYFPFEGCSALKKIDLKRADTRMVEVMFSAYGPDKDDTMYFGLFGDSSGDSEIEKCKVYVPDIVYSQYATVFQSEYGINIIPESMRDRIILDGDVNGDNEVSIADAVMLQNYLLGKEADILWYNAAIISRSQNMIFKDSLINIFDFIELKRMVLNNPEE